MTKLVLRLALAFALFSPTWALAQSGGSPAANAGALGMNLDELKDWNPVWVFTDAIKNARPWISQVPGSNVPWNTGATLSLDQNGWPLLGFGQAAGTLMFKELEGHYPGGLYTIYYDGSGFLEYGNDAAVISRAPGQDQIWVTPSDNGIHLKIAQSQSGNPVRNVRVILPGFEQSYQSQLFHPLFLERLAPFSVLRFMQWQNTNYTTIKNWWERTTPTTWTQSGERGVCVEYMCALANQIQRAPWFCVQHEATNDFIREFARGVYQQLDPALPVYIEYSNEVWNTAFPAHDYAKALGVAANLDSNPYNASQKWYADRSVEIFDIWRQEWQNLGGSAAANRVVRVLAAQSANPAIGQIVMDWHQAYQKADAYAVAPYFGHSFGDVANQWSTISKPNSQILNELRQEINSTLTTTMVQNVQNANARGLALISYEGGQHLVGTGGAQSNPQLVQKLVDVNRDPGMYDVYQDYVKAWRNAGAGVMVPYTFCGSYTSWGSWGHIEWMDQPLNEAHKMRSILDWQNSLGQGQGQPVQPSVSAYGQGCWNLSIASQGNPVVGGNFTVTLNGAPWWGAVFLFLSNSNSDYFGLPVPFDLSTLGAPGCTLLVGSSIVYPSQASPTGFGSRNFQIPALPSLAGTDLYLQWAAAMSWAGPLGLGLSNALAVRIGS